LAYAPSRFFLVCPRNSVKVGFPDRSERSTSVLTKNPIRLSSSLCRRLATAKPSTMSDSPLYRDRNSENAACIVMNKVASLRWPIRLSPASTPPPTR
jgi:hypothetical protein